MYVHRLTYRYLPSPAGSVSIFWPLRAPLHTNTSFFSALRLDSLTSQSSHSKHATFLLNYVFFFFSRCYVCFPFFIYFNSIKIVITKKNVSRFPSNLVLCQRVLKFFLRRFSLPFFFSKLNVAKNFADFSGCDPEFTVRLPAANIEMRR